MNTRKKTAFGILGVAATAALALGASAPAMADDVTDTSSYTEFTTGLLNGSHFGATSPVVIAPQLGTGDILSGNASGNSVGNGSVGNGNVVGSGNDSAIGSGNTTGIDGVDVDASDLVDSTVGDITGDITGDVSDLLDDIDTSLDFLFED